MKKVNLEEYLREKFNGVYPTCMDLEDLGIGIYFIKNVNPEDYICPGYVPPFQIPYEKPFKDFEDLWEYLHENSKMEVEIANGFIHIGDMYL